MEFNDCKAEYPMTTELRCRRKAKFSRQSFGTYGKNSRTAAMKLNDHKAVNELTTELRRRRKAGLRRRRFETPGKNSGLSDATVDTMPSVSYTWHACHCFRCAPIRSGDFKWAVLFQCSELNAATQIAWFLPQRIRVFFSNTCKGAFASYKMGLPQLIRTCTLISGDGLRSHRVYQAAWVMRLRNTAFDISNGPLFPRTIFGGIAQFLDFDEISTLSMSHTFMRCYIKSEMNQLRCFKVQDGSDMSNMFGIMEEAVSNYGRRYLQMVTRNCLNLPGLCKYSNNTLTLLAGMDRVYKRDLENQVDAFRQNSNRPYRFILETMFIQYIEQLLPFNVDIVAVRVYLTDQGGHGDVSTIGEIIVDAFMAV